ncbi:MAG: hypothetical protein GXO43_10070 [Crenarchaeota archaeon]|nr:hypothetical protein [Thermoproteota archaeon]
MISNNVRVSNKVEQIIEQLKNKDFIITNLPYITRLDKGTIELTFRRALVFRFKDKYSTEIEEFDNEKRVIVRLRGRKSYIEIEFLPIDGTVKYFIDYTGPRRWIVRKHLENIPLALIMRADKLSRRKTVTFTGTDYSEKLSRFSWVSRIIMKSILLLRTRLAIDKGGLLHAVEEVIAETKDAKRYRALYISGESGKNKFRLLFINGELAGKYVILNGQEYFDEEHLNEYKGLTRIRVYGIIDEKTLEG